MTKHVVWVFRLFTVLSALVLACQFARAQVEATVPPGFKPTNSRTDQKQVEEALRDNDKDRTERNIGVLKRNLAAYPAAVQRTNLGLRIAYLYLVEGKPKEALPYLRRVYASYAPADRYSMQAVLLGVRCYKETGDSKSLRDLLLRSQKRSWTGPDAAAFKQYLADQLTGDSKPVGNKSLDDAIGRLRHGDVEALKFLYQAYTTATKKSDAKTVRRIEQGLLPLRDRYPEIIDFTVYRESMKTPTERRSIIDELKTFPASSAAIPYAMVAQIEEQFIKNGDYKGAELLAQRLVDGKGAKDRLLNEDFKDVGLKWLMDCRVKLGDRAAVKKLVEKVEKDYPNRFTTYGEKQFLQSDDRGAARSPASIIVACCIAIVVIGITVVLYRNRGR